VKANVEDAVRLSQPQNRQSKCINHSDTNTGKFGKLSTENNHSAFKANAQENQLDLTSTFKAKKLAKNFPQHYPSIKPCISNQSSRVTQTLWSQIASYRSPHK